MKSSGTCQGRLLFPGGRTVAVWAVFLAVSGCVENSAYLDPTVEVPGSFSESGKVRQPDRWWTVFGSRELNGFVSEAFRSELNLQAAWERFRAAEAVQDRETASLFPELDGIVDAERFDGGGGGNRDGRDGGRGGEDGKVYELGFDASYEIDLWGRIRAASDAERFRASATFADAEAFALALAAEVTSTWMQLLDANARLSLLGEQIETNEKLLTQLKNQFAGGQGRSVDVVRQQQLIAATRQEKHSVESEIRVLENRFAVLLGRPPQSGFKYTQRTLPGLPPLPDTGIPCDLVQRRPDVRAAFDRLRAANRDMAAAVSDQYPRLTLTASITSEDEGAEQLFENWARTFAANLVAPLLDGGRRRAEVRRTLAVEYQLLYDYGQVILTAFQEVEDALVQEKLQLRQIRELEEQVRLADRAYDQLLVEYLNGFSNFIDLLTALTDRQELRRTLISARRQALEYRIDLYRALAGGCSDSDLPES